MNYKKHYDKLIERAKNQLLEQESKQMKKYVIVDTQNMFMRAVHVTRGDAEQRASMSLHIMLASIAQAWRIFDADHIVFALECPHNNNWRRTIDPGYKANRTAATIAQSQKEKEEAEIIFGTLNNLIFFLREKTNVTVLQCPCAEADDMIARWTQLHKDDKHVIISSDKDFHQLVKSNVMQYDGVNKKIFISKTFSLTEFANLEAKVDKDINFATIEDPEWLLFEKIIRGDPGDNIFSAYPGARKKGSKKKVGIIEAYNDRNNQGYNWHTFMNVTWTDHNKKDHIVKDDFAKNTKLIDLSRHPDNVKTEMDNFIIINTSREPVTKVSIPFMKFCKQHELIKMLDRADEFKKIFMAKYE